MAKRGDAMTDHRRIREGDVLSDMHLELCSRALTLKPYDADARHAFVEAARQVLDAVPDRHQRIAWATQLSLACTIGMSLHGIPGEFDIMRQLWEHA
jgi:hypothetical protein